MLALEIPKSLDKLKKNIQVEGLPHSISSLISISKTITIFIHVYVLCHTVTGILGG